VPGAIIYMLLNAGFHYDDIRQGGQMMPPVRATLNLDLTWKALPAFLLSVFAGLRLARFNLDTRQTEDFIGMATPTMTLFVVGLMLIFDHNSFGLRPFIINPLFLFAVILIFSYLMVSELRMFSFKFKGRSWRYNKIRFIFIGISAILLILLREAAFAAIVLVYILAVLLQFAFKQN